MPEEKNEATEMNMSEEELPFLSLVYSLAQAAWSWLGKQAHPVTRQVETDLVQAKAMIDMLRVIRRKTEGNLTAKEQNILDNILSDLEINYVTESSKGK
jgi:hypothetical protein